MPLVSRGALKTKAISRADYENSGFAKDDDLNEWIDEGYREFYDLLVASTEDHFVEGPISFQGAAGLTAIPVSVMPNFYRLKGIDIATGPGQFVPVPSFNFRDRNQDTYAPLHDLWRDRAGTTCSRYSYRLVGSGIRLSPALDDDTNFNLWYIPSAPALTTDASTFDDFNGWAAYVVAYAARMLKVKAEESTAAFDADMARIAARINTISRRRDEGEISTITAVE